MAGRLFSQPLATPIIIAGLMIAIIVMRSASGVIKEAWIALRT